MFKICLCACYQVFVVFPFNIIPIPCTIQLTKGLGSDLIPLISAKIVALRVFKALLAA